MIDLVYAGAAFDASGYAKAARGYIEALLEHPDINLSVTAVSFERDKTNHGVIQNKIQAVLNRQVNNKIQITHLTPENYPRLVVPGKYNIGYTTWETETLPKGWADLCNKMDEIWVPSEWNKQYFAECGVKKPIFVVPHVVEKPDMSDMHPVSMGVDDDTFVFYSIFQWIERKNPVGLLLAYLTEFKPEEKVVLALKTYRLNTSVKEQDLIKKDIANLKAGLNMVAFPTIKFFGVLLSDAHMKGFHHRGDCFVLPHRGEGFGLPMAESMALGKPVISTNYSGSAEFMNNDNSYLIDSRRTPVYGMVFKHYTGDMIWGDPDIMHLRKLMRHVYENRSEAKAIGSNGAAYIHEHHNKQVIGELIVNRLKEIEKGI